MELRGIVWIGKNRKTQTISHKNKIYTLDDRGFEVFDPEVNSWKILPYLPNKIGGKLVSVHDKLIVFGSYDKYERDLKLSKTLIEFDPINNSWIKLFDLDLDPIFDHAVMVN